MKGIALLLLCAVALSQANRLQLSRGGKTCICDSEEAKNVCARYNSDGKLIVHENCNQFYKCANGQAVPYFCPKSLVYDAEAEMCDWPTNISCGSRPIVEESEADCSEEESESESESEEDDTEENGNEGTCNCNPAEAPNLCGADGSEGVLVAHENCNQFYKCANGVPVTLDCNANLLYNPYTQICDWPEQVKCGDRIVDVEDSSSNEVGHGKPDEVHEICSAHGSNGIVATHQNCNQFYRCELGVPVVLTCPVGLLYNPLILMCDWGTKVDCGDRHNGNGDNGGEDNETTGPCNCDPAEAPGICAVEGSDGTLTAHENCNRFYKCANGVPVAFTCPSGLLYDPYIELCDWADKVKCGDRPIVETDNGNGNGDGDNGEGGSGNEGPCNCNPAEAVDICAVKGSDGTFVAHENCNQFYKCANGVPVAFNCPAGLLYNPYIELCDWADKVKCGNRPIVKPDNGDGGSGNEGPCNCNPAEAVDICAANASDGTFVAHENCNQFYKCANGVPVAFNCPSGLLYNPYTELCDWADKVKCGDRPIVKPDNGNGDNGNGNGDGDNGDGGSGNEGPCNCNPAEAVDICAATGSDGTFVAHENCNQFYKCANGVPVAFNCPAGLLYNPYIELCDWADKVKCGDRPIVETDNGNGNGDGDNGEGGSGNEGPCNCNPAEAVDICAVKGSDGTFVAHENCNQFYKCANGVPVAFNCPAGLLYNPYIELCDWADKVKCGNRPIVKPDNGDGGSGNEGPCNCNPAEAVDICAANASDGTFVAHENCNQFYKCANGVPVAFNCPSGLLYNPYTELCDWADKVKCGDRPIVKPDNGNGDNGNGNGDGDNGDGGSGNEGPCNCNPAEAVDICAATGSDGTFVAHENCNQFYKCANGVPVAFNCPAGLLYNPYIELCDWADKVKCGDRPIVKPDNGNGDNGNGNGDGDNGDGGSSNEGPCNCNSAEAVDICAAKGSDGAFVAHENCNQFYKCANGVPVAFNCPAGLLYNPYIELCDWADKVKCGDRPIVKPDNGDGGSGNEGPCNCNPAEAVDICAANGSDGTFVAHENCNQFYKCANGVPVAFNCPSDLLYNPYTERCDWADKVKCGDRPIVKPDNGNGDNGNGNGDGDNGDGGSGNEGPCNCNPAEAVDICAAKGSDGTFVAHENCNQFYKCANGVPVAFNCPAGLLYNPYIELCDWADKVKCGDRPIVKPDNGDGGSGNEGPCNCNPAEAVDICAAKGSDGTFVAHENCNQFYKCANGVPVAFNCPAGLLYNPYIELCDWADKVKCGDRPNPETDNGNGDNGNGNGNGDGEKPCNCNPGEAPAICATGNSEGVLIAHEKCNKFYKCSFGSPITIKCPGKLLYNPFIEVCDWPENVECGDRVAPDNNGGSDNGAGGDNNGGENDGGDNGGNNETGNCDPSQAPAICATADSNGVLVAHENCDKFYVCSFGLPEALSCPANLLYNPKIEQCDWPRNVDCGDRVVPEPDIESESGTCLCYPRQAPNICAESNSNGMMIAHEMCNQFYVCFNGQPIARSCPASLFYEPHTKQCNWPVAVNCDGRGVTTYYSLNKHMQARKGIF